MKSIYLIVTLVLKYFEINRVELKGYKEVKIKDADLRIQL